MTCLFTHIWNLLFTHSFHNQLFISSKISISRKQMANNHAIGCRLTSRTLNFRITKLPAMKRLPGLLVLLTFITSIYAQFPQRSQPAEESIRKPYPLTLKNGKKVTTSKMWWDHAGEIGNGWADARETGVMNDEIAFRQHSAGHTPGPNWPIFLDYAARYFK